MLQEALQSFADPVMRVISKLFGGRDRVPAAPHDEYPVHLVSLLTESGVPAEPLRHVREVLIKAAECLKDVEARAEGRRKAEIDGPRLAAIHKQIQQWRYRTIPEPTHIFGEFGWAAIEGYFQVFEKVIPFVKGKVPADGVVMLSVKDAKAAHIEMSRGILALSEAVKELPADDDKEPTLSASTGHIGEQTQ